MIRKMTATDYPEAFKLWSKTEGMGLRSLDDSIEGIGKFLGRNPGTSFVCIEEEKMVGVILCGHDGRRGYIYHTAVEDDSRGKGIGRELVDAAIRALKKEGITKAALVVFADNADGNAFWESLGFTTREDLTYRNFSIVKQ